MDHLLKNAFTEAAGARKGFPKVAMIITDGKSQDPVEDFAKKLRNMGVEIFVLGMWLQATFPSFTLESVTGICSINIHMAKQRIIKPTHQSSITFVSHIPLMLSYFATNSKK